MKETGMISYKKTVKIPLLNLGTFYHHTLVGEFMTAPFTLRYRLSHRICGLIITIVMVMVLLAGCGSGGGGGGDNTPPLIAVTVSPDSAQLVPAQVTTFSASVSGTNNQQIIWSVLEGLAGGTITNTGVYTAPGLAGTFHVVASSQADPQQSTIVTITVLSGAANGTVE
jgi:hypothetical protein